MNRDQLLKRLWEIRTTINVLEEFMATDYDNFDPNEKIDLEEYMKSIVERRDYDRSKAKDSKDPWNASIIPNSF